MIYTGRRLALAIVSLPIVAIAYGAIYFGLALIANAGVSIGLFFDNLVAVSFAWIVVITFAKQISDYINKIGRINE